MVGAVLGDEHRDGLGDRLRVDAVELDAARRLRLVVPDEPHALGRALDERAARDHLADVEPGAVLAAQPTERRVGDARHRREHDRHVERERPDRQRGRRVARTASMDMDILSILPERAVRMPDMAPRSRPRRRGCRRARHRDRVRRADRRPSSLEEAAAILGITPADIVKSLVVKRHDGTFLFALIPGDRQISWAKLRAVVGRQQAAAAGGIASPSRRPATSAAPSPRSARRRRGRSSSTRASSGKRVSMGAGEHGLQRVRRRRRADRRARRDRRRHQRRAVARAERGRRRPGAISA